MPWVRFEDDYLGSQKLSTLPTAAIALDMAGIIYSSRELRDGHLSVRDIQVLSQLLGIRRWQPVVDELVRVKRWTGERDGGYGIHDYLDYQPSREQILTQRAADRERKRRGRGAGTPTDSGRIPSVPDPVPDPDVPNGTSGPPNPPRRARGAKRIDRRLSDGDEADLAAMQSRAILVGNST